MLVDHLAHHIFAAVIETIGHTHLATINDGQPYRRCSLKIQPSLTQRALKKEEENKTTKQQKTMANEKKWSQFFFPPSFLMRNVQKENYKNVPCFDGETARHLEML